MQKKSQLLLLLFAIWLDPRLDRRAGFTTTTNVCLNSDDSVDGAGRNHVSPVGVAKVAIKPLIIALGVVLLFDFYLLAEATLLGRINHQTWQGPWLRPCLYVAIACGRR